MESISQALNQMIDGQESKPISTAGHNCPHCGVSMHRITTVRLNGQDLPFGPFVCDCPDFSRQREEERLHKQAEEQRRLQQEQRDRVERLFRQCALPERWHSRTFAAFQLEASNSEAFAIAKKYAEDFDPKTGKGLLFGGDVGLGKTHLAAAIAMELLGREHSVIFGTVSSLLSRIRSTYDNGREHESEVINQLVRCDLLVIDELGKEKVTEWVAQIVYDLINARYEHRKAIVITTNLNLTELRHRYNIGVVAVDRGDAIVDRVLEICQGVQMTGESWRQKSRL